MHSTFSTWRFLLVVFTVSYPFQIAYYFLGERYRQILLLSMVAAGVGAFLCGRYVFRDGFAGAGWAWARVRHYALALLLAVTFWVLPSFAERILGWFRPLPGVGVGTILVSIGSGALLTLLPAFGEEFAWRGYLLPRLVNRQGVRRGLLFMGFITWIWHVPFLVANTLLAGGAGTSLLNVLAVSLVPTVLHAVIFAYLWNISGSLLVATVYHVLFDEIRDGLLQTVGLGFFGQNWQIIAISLLGAILLYRVNWYRQPNI